MSFYLLFLNNLIPSFFKERLRRNRGMSSNISLNSLLQPIANSSCNTFFLIIGMNKQTVKVTHFIYVPKAYNNFIFDCNYAVMFLKRLIPFL